jgi:GMP synthase (glutamine-hydrolysing)
VTPRLLVVEHEATCTADRFGGWLRDEGVDLDVRAAHRGDPLPSSLDDHDGLLVLGGAMGAGDDDQAPWLPATRALLARSVGRDEPVLGICLGAQLLAVACGGTVERGVSGIEPGVVDVGWRPEARGDALVGALCDPCPAPSLHADAITALPPGATWLGATARYPYQAFRLGARTWGLQFHPEVSPAAFRQWAYTDADLLRAQGDDPDAVAAQLEERDGEVTGAGRAMCAAFAAVLGSAPD